MLEGPLLHPSACSAVRNSTPIISPTPRTSRDRVRVNRPELPQSGQQVLALPPWRWPAGPRHSITRAWRGRPRTARGCRRRSSRARPRPTLHQLGARAMNAPSGRPGGDALGADQDVRLHAGVLDRPHPAGAAHARLHLVGDEQDAVLVAQRAQPRPARRPAARCSRPRPAPARRRSPRPRRRHLVAEQRVLEVVERRLLVMRPRCRSQGRRRLNAYGACRTPGSSGAEALVVLGLRRGQADRAVGAAVEGAEEADHVRPARSRTGRASSRPRPPRRRSW